MESQALFYSAVILSYAIFALGAAGCFLPVIPGVLLAGIVPIVFKLCVPFAPLSWFFVWTALGVSLFIQFADFIFTYYGAKKFGATKWGGIGAFVGVFAGMFIPPQIVFIFIAPLIFSAVFEFVAGASFAASVKAGIGSFLGVVISSVIKFLIVVFMVLWFSVEMWAGEAV